MLFSLFKALKPVLDPVFDILKFLVKVVTTITEKITFYVNKLADLFDTIFDIGSSITNSVEDAARKELNKKNGTTPGNSWWGEISKNLKIPAGATPQKSLAMASSPMNVDLDFTKHGAHHGHLGSEISSVESSAPRNVIVNIKSLIENLNLTSQTFNQGIGDVRRQVSQALIAAVSDSEQSLSFR
jgi:hypothetical protein